MPVHAVAGGWRWGRSGKVYKTKAAAERQARAIYASGYKEDGTPRPSRMRQLHKALQPPRRGEAAYVRALVQIMRGVHDGVRQVLHREVFHEPSFHADDVRDPFGKKFEERLFAFLGEHVGRAHDAMSDDVYDAGATAAKLLGIRENTPGLDAIIDRSRDENVQLIRGASEDFLDDVRGLLREHAGARQEDIAEALAERTGISERRAALIARDQTAKLSGSLNHERQQAAGVTQFVWSTSRDERVRETHAELEGETFDYDDPPIVDGEPSLPTEPVNCRCVAIPVIPEAGEEESEDVAAE